MSGAALRVLVTRKPAGTIDSGSQAGRASFVRQPGCAMGRLWVTPR